MRIFSRLCTAVGLLICLSVAELQADQQVSDFISAKPIWPAGREKEMNLFVGFTAAFEKPQDQNVSLRIAGASLYRIYLNGDFLGHGPARGPHGYYRVGQWHLPKEKLKQKNIIAIEVAGYNSNSYYLLDQPSFLQAEVITDNTVLASTNGKGTPFQASILNHRLQKVQRYSFQRPFIEYYRLTENFDKWHTDTTAPFEKTTCTVQPNKNIIPHRVPYPYFKIIKPKLISTGQIQTIPTPGNLWKDRSLTNISPKLKGYPEDKLEIIPSIELQKNKSVDLKETNKISSPNEPIEKNTFQIYDLGTNLTGFIGASIQCSDKCKIYFTFDEILSNNDVNFRRLGCVNAVGYELVPGRYELESFEPYTMRYIKLIVLEGSCRIENICLRELANPKADLADFDCSDARLKKIFEAARQTFRQNATDIFMDCPSRERAGWLCDSFFTARVALDLTGETTIEKNMYENFLLPEKFDHLPDGMLPMCYPADHNDGVFIPNWAMWFVIQLEEYLARSGDKEMVTSLEPKVMALLNYFKKFENESLLLENLESWVFVEWSKANEFVQNVNFPSNMLYAEVLSAAGRMYNKPQLIEKADRLRQTIRELSFDGKFFIDNAVRKDGILQLTNNKTEVCQYFAFFFNVADTKSHPQLWSTLRDEFGPKRKDTKAHPDVHPANAFVGNYLRLELLSRNGNTKQIKNEIADYFLYMADQTGSLWENVSAYASCNHGFASHVAHCLYRDILGITEIDNVNKKIKITFTDVGLNSCYGIIPTPAGPVSLKWKKENNKLIYRLDTPPGYKTKIKNLTNFKLIPSDSF